MKGIFSWVICMLMLCTVMPLAGYAADGDAASVTFGGNTEYYTTIDAAWEAAIALDTTAENKATIQLLADCTAENALTNTEDYLILDTNGKTLTGTSLLSVYRGEVYYAIGVDGGSLELTGNGTIAGCSTGHFGKAVLMINGGEVYADGITIYNVGTANLTGSTAVYTTGGAFHLLDGHLLTTSEYALDAEKGKVYLYSGKIESTGRYAMINSSTNVQICYSTKPLYLVDNETDNWAVVSAESKIYLEDNILMDIEYGDAPDGSDSTLLEGVTTISADANTNRNYLKIQTYKLHTVTVNATEGGTASSSSAAVKDGESVTLTATAADDSYNFEGWYDGDTKVSDTAEFTVENVTEDKTYTAKFTKKVSRLFSTRLVDTLITRDIFIKYYREMTAVHFVDLADYDLTNITWIDYSEDGDGSVKAWLDGTELYIGGYEKIIAGDLQYAFSGGVKIDRITGLDMLDTSRTYEMRYMFYNCGSESEVFTLDLGNNFDTSNARNMSYMFHFCGRKSPVFTLNLGNKFDTSHVAYMNYMFNGCGEESLVFTLDLGDKFDTSCVADMRAMFENCGSKSTAFKTLDLSTFTVEGGVDIRQFATGMPASTLIFGEGWRNAEFSAAVPGKGAFYTSNPTETTVIGAPVRLVRYDWAADNRTAVFPDKEIYTITAVAEEGGSVSGGGPVVETCDITLIATADDGYTFEGWYVGDKKMSDKEQYVVAVVTESQTYTAKFTKNQVDPESDVPYLKWDGSTLTLVKKEGVSCRVGIVYVGGATFDADSISWEKLVAAGKEYADLNSSVGYAVYANFTERTPGTRGNYVAFVKYTKEDGTTTADYITFTVKNAVSFEKPSLSYNAKTKTLSMTGNVSATIGVAYVGDAEFNASSLTWNDFVKAGKKYPNLNGSSGYAKAVNTLDYTKTFGTKGNYIAFVKYFDENLNKTVVRYYTFTVSDNALQPTDAPFAAEEANKIVLTANGFDVAKVTIVYIGTENMDITNWNEFASAAAQFSEINGKDLNQQYANPKDGSAWGQETAGWYAIYIRYTKNGKTYNLYYTAELNK